MANRKTRSPALVLAYAIMSDGQKYRFWDLLERCQHLIPEEQAIKTYRNYRKRGLIQRGHPVTELSLDDKPRDEQIAIGRREIFRNAISSARHIGITIVNGDKWCYYHQNALNDPAHRPTISEAKRNAAGRPSSAEMERVYELLADGKWHTFEEAVAAASKAIAPGRAIRYRNRMNELQRERLDRLRGDAPKRKVSPRPEKDVDTIIATGKREIARRAVRTSKKIIHYKTDSAHWVRLRQPGEVRPESS